VFPIHVPPLRERPSDIPSLALFFVSRFARQFGKTVEAISQETMDRLMQYSWPGNVRELQNIIERAVVLSHGPMLSLGKEQIWGPETNLNKALAAAAASGATAAPSPGLPALAPNNSSPEQPQTLAEIQRRHMIEVLEQVRWIIEGEKGAAKRLDLHPNTLRSRMKKLGIQRPAHDIS
jgi:formate hydrogenlyase transcriptional activator